MTIETKEIAVIRREVGGLVGTARKLVVNNDAQDANELLVLVANGKKRLEEQRVFLVKPLNDHVKNINAAFKEWVKPLEEADSIVRRKVLGFQREQAALRAEAQRLEQERLEKLEQIRIERLAELPEGLLDDLPEDEPIPMAVPEMPRAIRGKSGSTSTRKTWTFEVTDDSLIPRKYLMADEGVILLAVREGVRDIPGIRIYQQESLAVRTK